VGCGNCVNICACDAVELDLKTKKPRLIQLFMMVAVFVVLPALREQCSRIILAKDKYLKW